MRFLPRAIAVRAISLAVVMTLAVSVRAQNATDTDLEQLLARATWYSIDFVNKLSQVVSEERYIQDSSVALPTVPIMGMGRGGASALSSQPRGTAKHRELRADFLIVKASGDMWSPFRDVFEVDRIPVRDREERLAKLFLNKTDRADSNDENARAIAEESARYNLGAVQRTINNPVFALLFLQPDIRSHFKFTPGKPDRKAGDDVRIVEYVEELRPTVITGGAGRDMPAFGRFWIENATGRVVKAEVRVEVSDVKANLTTTFRTDERLGIDVPVEFREDYDLRDGRVSGVASYSRFRRFQVNSSEELSPPAPDAQPNKSP
jgi:hypothetical protein